jgi:phosphoribosylformylglycinamidine (FGAM) synthase-like enzyme
VREAVRAGLLSSAHDIAEGGLAIALAECCLAGALGAQVELGSDFPEATGSVAPDDGPPPSASARISAALFGEGPGGFLVSGPAEALGELEKGTAVRRLGTVGGDSLSIVLGDSTIAISLSELGGAHAALAELFS